MSPFRSAAFVWETLKERKLGALRFLARWYVARLAGYPHTLNFEVSSFCNLKCRFCYTHSERDYSGRSERKLSIDVFRRVIDGASRFCSGVSLHGMGEPLMHESFWEMARYAARAGMDVSFSTNGLLLSDENHAEILRAGIRRVIFSIDGCSESTYMYHRAGSKLGDFQRLKDTIRTLAQHRDRMRLRWPILTLQFIVTKVNAHELSSIEELGRAVGADEVVLMSLAIDDYVRDPKFGARVEEEFFLPSSQAFSRYSIGASGERRLSGSETNRRCPQLAMEPVITSDARITGCCKDLHTLDNTFGDLRTESFREIWKSESYSTFRRERMLPAKLKMCDSCFPSTIPFAKTIALKPSSKRREPTAQ